jgi:hypothetical protein
LGTACSSFTTLTLTALAILILPWRIAIINCRCPSGPR